MNKQIEKLNYITSQNLSDFGLAEDFLEHKKHKL